ncbi:MAG: quaternary amine ABC transporter ATP-binding protein [Desulfomonilia bacterium]
MDTPVNENQHDNVCIQVNNLWKIFGPDPLRILNSDLKKATKSHILEKTGCIVAVRDVSCTIYRNEFFVFMGLSGSGKSTVIRLLIRLIRPTNGQIVINGDNICSYSKQQLMNFRRNTVSMVFQNYGLFPHRSVIENVSYGLKVKGVSKEERYARAQEAIETVRLKGWEDYYPPSLSGGMQQRVGLARALATDPEILFMDEPFSGLDPLIRREMQDELIELQDKIHKTILFVTHDLDEALKLGDRISIMKDGRIIQTGTPEEIITTPSDDYVKEFVQDASPAKVLSAGSIMEEPTVLVYDWQGPKAASYILKREKVDCAFVVSRDRTLRGRVTAKDLLKLIQSGDSGSMQEVLETDITTCTPDTLMQDLFSLAASSDYHVPVVDERGRLLGEVSTRSILSSMIQEENEADE